MDVHCECLHALFSACKNGNIEDVEHLISKGCNIDVEVKGEFEVNGTMHKVTPLWCAAVSGHLNVVQALLKYGANIDAVSDSGSTPLRSTCFRIRITDNLDMVKLLVQHGADIQKANHSGGTCLINSIQSYELCKFLLENGAQVNAQDQLRKTALHYAIQDQCLRSIPILLQYGADPFLANKYGDDALQHACLKKAEEVLTILIESVKSYKPQRVAAAYELMGSTFLDVDDDTTKALYYWNKACDLREAHGVCKPILPGKAVYDFTLEFRTKQDLEAIALDQGAMRFQSLLICERILGASHRETSYRLLLLLNYHSTRLNGLDVLNGLNHNIEKCIHVWYYTVVLLIDNHTILCQCGPCLSAGKLVEYYLVLYFKSREEQLNQIILKYVVHTIELLLNGVKRSFHLLQIIPRSLKQQESFNNVLILLTNLLYIVIALEIDQSNNQLQQLKYQLVDLKSTIGNSLLHLCVMESTGISIEDHLQNTIPTFPNANVAKLLIEWGAKINSPNSFGNTPLHIAALQPNYRKEIMELLLENGALLNPRNCMGEKPLNMIKFVNEEIGNVSTLKCLAAVTIARTGLKYKDQIPSILHDYIEVHWNI